MNGPSVADERLMELRDRGLPAAPRVPWRSHGIGVSIAFFLLTLVAVAALYGLLTLVESGLAWFTTILSIAAAEYLVRAHRFFGTGVESALWLAGLCVLVFELPGEGSEAVVLLFAAAAAIAGWRMRNGLFGALAALLVIAYAWFWMEGGAIVAAAVSLSISLAALAALGRQWRRPSTERLWVALLLVPPAVSLFGSAAFLPAWWAILYAVVAAASLAFGLGIRAHAPLIGAAVYAVHSIAVLTRHDLLPLPVEWRLIVGGTALLAGSALISRMLRERTRGVVATPAAVTEYYDEAQIVATLALRPDVEASPERPEGGRFGGAGATGDY